MAKDHLRWLREGQEITTAERIKCILMLSIPAILSQISVVAMEYIDAAMVGKLGQEASASIGLVSSSTWLIGGISSAVAIGFTVQVAHSIGARQDKEARGIVKHGLLTVLVFSLLIATISIIIGAKLPVWLGGGEDIVKDAGNYFRIYAASLPIMLISYACDGMLQCSGNVKTPSLINIFMCVINIFFNAIFIFPSRYIDILGTEVFIPGAGLKVTGAALGTASAELVGMLLMLYFLLIKSEKLHYRKEKYTNDYALELKKAIKISLPIAIEKAIGNGAQIASTKIVSPLGNTSIAANSFSVTAEGLCYMPGYGVAAAATSLIGQSVGARRKDETRKLGWLTVGLGMLLMTASGILMYIFAPEMLGILTPVKEIQDLGTEVLRIEAFAEPFFAASIVVAGVFRGEGKTFISTLINLLTMWLVRIPLAAFLAPQIGLRGVWIAMAIQLTVCGTIFLLVLFMSNLKNCQKK